MRCVLGFDGGGTKTDCVLMDESGTILARTHAGPSNPLRVGAPAALAALQQATQQAFSQAGVAAQSLTALCAALAGAGQSETADKMTAALTASFPGISIRVCTDLDATLAATGKGAAIVLIAGTGSVVVGRDAIGRVARAGGQGPLLGDEGSAYDIGRRAVAAALRDRDRTDEDSALGKQILRQLGCSNWPEVQRRVASFADEVFPRVFPVVAVAADAGDAVARTLLLDAAGELVTLVKIVATRLGLGDANLFLAKTGGTLGRSKFFDAQLDALLREALPKAEIGPLPIAPAEAAARLALRLVSAEELAGK